MGAASTEQGRERLIPQGLGPVLEAIGQLPGPEERFSVAGVRWKTHLIPY